MVGRITLGIIVLTLAGCSSHYKTALRDVGLTSERRVAQRVTSMEKSAREALEEIGEATDAVRGAGQQRSTRAAAHRARLVNDAEAAVFEYSRHVLMVGDVLADAGTPAPAETAQLQASMRAAEESLVSAVGAVQGRLSEAVGQEVGDDLSAPPSGHDDLDRFVAQAEADVEAMSRDAGALLDAMGKSPAQRSPDMQQ